MSFIKKIFTSSPSSNGGQSRAPPRPSTDTRPFPRYSGLADLTWDQCFAMNRKQILASFVEPLTGAQETSRMAYLLSVMMHHPADKAASTAILTTLFKDVKGDPMRWPRVDNIDPQTQVGEREEVALGSVHWEPTGGESGRTGLHLYCYTVTDLLGACMAEATHLWPGSAEFKRRTKRNFYARLIALFSHWCVRVTGESRRPMKVGLAVASDVIILGSCIPDVPQYPQAKVAIRKARFLDLKKRGRNEGGMRQTLDVTRVNSVLWEYGNCAETWTFALLSKLTEATLPKAFGIAVNVPVGRQDIGVYDERWERSKERYAPLCVNCEKLMKQIVRWGKPGDKVVENFSVWKWEGPQ